MEAVTRALVALESGDVFEGISFGAEGETAGELVFNTSMAGYQEIVTDPSYNGQIVTMTSPHIGNYGVNAADAESRKPFAAGLLVREVSGMHSNWRADESIQAYFKRHQLIGVADIDTRALTKRLRDAGALRGVVSTRSADAKALVAQAKAIPSMGGQELASGVSCETPYLWLREAVGGSHRRDITTVPAREREGQRRVVVMDFGVKFNTLRSLADRGCQVVVVPAKTTAAAIEAMDPDGIMVSNGPGDPAAVTYGIQALRDLIASLDKKSREERFAVMGICLGHQLLGHALGGKTFKLKFGHRGGNHPVRDNTTGKIEITSQNHGFAVDAASLPPTVEMTHVNLNDNTCEGLRHKSLPIFAVQYHPEAAPGPHDAGYLFDRFLELMK